MRPTAGFRFSVAVPVLLAAIAAAGCADKVTDSRGGMSYLPRTSPENVAHDLVAAYQNRDEAAYADLLAPEFRFYFQSGDVPADLGRAYWVREEDSSHTGSLFGASEVRGIAVELDYGPATDPTELDKPAGSKKIHVTARVEVDGRHGTTYLAEGDFEDLFFRKGLAENPGEDPALWYLFEWRDIRNRGGNGAAPGGGLTPQGTEAPTPVRSISWGLIKQLFP